MTSDIENVVVTHFFMHTVVKLDNSKIAFFYIQSFLSDQLVCNYLNVENN